MKKLLLSFALWLSAFTATSQYLEWGFGIGSNGLENALQCAVHPTSGDLYILGYFSDTLDADPTVGVTNLYAQVGEVEMCLIKYDSAGSLVWARSFGSVTSDIPSDIAFDTAGNILITGAVDSTSDLDPGIGVFSPPHYGNYDIIVASYTESGNFRWGYSLGNAKSQTGRGIETDRFGNYYLYGYINGTMDFDPGPGVRNYTATNLTHFIAKYSDTARLHWVKFFDISVPGWSITGDLVLDPSHENLYVCGGIGKQADLDPGPGTSIINSGGNEDPYLIKLDSAGNFIWGFALSGPSDFETADDISVLSDSSIVITGGLGPSMDFDPGFGTNIPATLDSGDIFIARYTPAGALVWVKTFGSLDTFWDDEPEAMTVDSKDNIYIGGNVNGTVDYNPGRSVYNVTDPGGGGGFVSKFNSDGRYQWAFQLGTGNANEVSALAIDAADNLYMYGDLAGGNTDLDPGPDSLMGPVWGNWNYMVGKYNVANPLFSGRAFLEALTDTIRSGKAYFYVDLPTVGPRPLVDSATINNDGTFSARLPREPYFVMVRADSTIHPDLVPTYMDSTMDWEDAISYIHHYDSTANKIYVQELRTSTDTGRITGRLVKGTINKGPGDPLEGVDISTKNLATAAIQDHTTSDPLGKFTLGGLEHGTYEIYVNIPGVPVDTNQFTLSPGNDRIDQVLITADSTLIYFGLDTQVDDPDRQEDQLLLYPNPASEKTFLSMYVARGGEWNYQLYDMSGAVVWQGQQQVSSGWRATMIPVGRIPQGNYIVRSNFGGMVSTTKLSVIR